MKKLILLLLLALSACDNSTSFGTLKLGMTKQDAILQCENADQLAFISNLGNIASKLFQGTDDSSNKLRNQFTFNNGVDCKYLDPTDNETIYNITMYFDIGNNSLTKNSNLTHFSINMGSSFDTNELLNVFNGYAKFYSQSHKQTIPTTFVKNNSLMKNPEFLDTYFTKFDDNIIIHMSQQSGVIITYCQPNICDEIVNSFTGEK